MPIYEFYCADCHRIYNFLARTANTAKKPKCPQCGRLRLERQVSKFAISKNRPESDEGDMFPEGMDESRFERAMEELGREAEGMNEDDPRQMARLMRKLFQSTGMECDGRMEEAMRRMESGEDPDALEEEFGDMFEGEGDAPVMAKGAGGRLRGLAKRLYPPGVDDGLYDL